ncbi:hypothetical protein [Propylenella binzhouense]|uniref:Tat pathway signal sequence domain protein n=1 Tax=Propylenella binzhouense TaxID=2555902 RepID=A0A964T6U2_9HYPH|nr:hypothetical protein [Propylenella binzhouense]MYZ49558.1 hypothetical protein [Propylenella binzhouense]
MRLARLWLAAFWLALPPAALAQGQAPQQGAAEARPEAQPGLPTHGAISLELNKLEGAQGACRAYFLVQNEMPVALDEMRLDVFLFDRSSVVLRRVALTYSDIRSNRMKVALFDLPDLDCGKIGRLLVNDVLACTIEGGKPIPDCADLLTVSSRADAEFRY